MRERIVKKVLDILIEKNISSEGEIKMIINNIVNMKSVNDMEPKADLHEDYARLCTYERGRCVCEFITSDEDEIIFYFIENVINCVANLRLDEKYRSEDGVLYYTKEVVAHKKKIKADAFRKIGGIYEKWYAQGRNALNMNI